MTPTLAPPIAPITELSTWLATAEEMLDRQMKPTDPGYAAAYEAWNERHKAYMARVRGEGEPE